MNGLPEGSLADIPAAAWARLERGAADRRTAFNKMQVGTIGAQGWPEMRSVVLRRVEAAERRITFHTDRRSAKAGEIEADGRVTLHFWDARAKLQIRLWGQARVVAEDPLAGEAWARLAPRQRATYLGSLPPGRPIETPEEGDAAFGTALGAAEGEAGEARGRGAFAVVPVTVMRLEWLHLREAAHRRARFDWGGEWQGRWLAP